MKKSYKYSIIQIFILIICCFLSYVIYGLFTYRNVNAIDVMLKFNYTFIDYVSVLIISFLLYCLYASKWNTEFANIVKDLWENGFKIVAESFIQLRNKCFLIGNIVLFFAVYGYQISNFTLSLDEEFQMSEVKNVIQWCYEGRFSIGILKSFYMQFGMYEPYLSSMIASLIMIVSGIMFCGLMDRVFLNRKVSVVTKLTFIAFFISFPSVIVEFMSFSTYCIEVSLGFLILIFATHLLATYFETKKKRYMVLNFFLVFFALGIYQAMATVYITLVSIYFFIIIYDEKDEKDGFYEKQIKNIIVSIIVFACSIIIFGIIYKIATKMHYVQGSIDYINGFSGWNLDIGIFPSIMRSIKKLWEILFETEITGLIFFKCFIGIALIDVLVLILLSKKWKRIVLPILLLEIVFSGFYMWLILASISLPFRAWLSIPLICGFVYFILINTIENYFNKTAWVICILAISLLGFRQIQTINELFVNDHKRMDKDIEFAKDIYHDIDSKIDNIESKTIVFIGTKDLANDETIIKNPSTDLYFGGDALGYSLWRRAQEPHRMKGLYSFLGYSLQFESSSEDETIMAEKKMNIYPKTGSIIEKGDKIYVRLE